MKHKINEANIRERILSDGYGKFDLIETIYIKDEILNAKPRVLLKNIMTRFSIPEGAINRKTFWSWLLRYKKKNNPSSFPTSIFQIENANRTKSPEHSEEWRDFKPSNAETLKQGKALIKVIK
jgi:hypothetical protein